MAHFGPEAKLLTLSSHRFFNDARCYNSPDMSQNVLKWYLGTEYTAGHKDNYFHGRLADFAIVNQQLTASQVNKNSADRQISTASFFHILPRNDLKT